MSKFLLTDSTGQTFEINAPDGTTLEQAKAILEQQQRSGSLVGLSRGNVLSARTQVEGGLAAAVSQLEPPKFSLKRLASLSSITPTTRTASTAAPTGIVQDLQSGGIFGVDSESRLGAVQRASLINQTFAVGSTVVSDTQQSTPGRLNRLQPAEIQTIVREQLISTDLDLTAVPINNPISAADYVQQPPPSFGLGPLSPSDLQGLMAQTAATTAQPINSVSVEQGVGKFGLTIDKLESTGYIKPGTAVAYKLNPEPNTTEKLQSFLTPSAFTGKNSVNNLPDILDDVNAQNKIQGDVLKQSFSQLTSTGLINQVPDTLQLAAALQTAATFDIKTAEGLIKGLDVKNIAEVKSVARAAEFAKSFSAKFAGLLSSGSAIESGIKRPQGSVNTVNRSTVNASIAAVIGNPKIPTPTFASKS
jgi:hypothetical protein